MYNWEEIYNDYHEEAWYKDVTESYNEYLEN